MPTAPAAPNPLDHTEALDRIDPAHRIAPTAEERCDHCGAAAKARALTPSGGMLLFCRHCLGGVDGARHASREPRDSDPPGVRTRRGLIATGAILIEF